MLSQKPTTQRKQVWYLLAAPALAFVAIGALLFNPNTANALQKDEVTIVSAMATEGASQEGNNTQQGKTPREKAKLTLKDTSDVLTAPEVQPEPVGGMDAFRRWVGGMYRYPQAAIKARASGQIVVSFTVETDGSLTDIKVVKDIGYGTGNALVKVLKKSKPWIPGIQKGKKVRVAYQLPLTLSL